MLSPQGNFYTFHDDLPIARVTILAEPTPEAWVHLMNSVFADVRYQVGLGMLVDRRRAPVPATKDVRAIVRYVDQREAAGDTRGWALVVSDLGSYGMGRMAQQWSEYENSLAVFRETEEAIAWLMLRSHEPVRHRGMA